MVVWLLSRWMNGTYRATPNLGRTESGAHTPFQSGISRGARQHGGTRNDRLDTAKRIRHWCLFLTPSRPECRNSSPWTKPAGAAQGWPSSAFQASQMWKVEGTGRSACATLLRSTSPRPRPDSSPPPWRNPCLNTSSFAGRGVSTKRRWRASSSTMGKFAAVSSLFLLPETTPV